MNSHNIKTIFKSFSLFYKFHPVKLITLFIITLLSGLTQGISVALLIPLLGLLQPGTDKSGDGHLIKLISSFFEKTGREESLTFILLIFCICMVFVAILSYFKTLMQSTYQQDFSHHIRKDLYKKIVAGDWEFLNRKGKHNYIQIITSEIPKMSTFYYFYLDLTTKIIFIAAHVIVAFFISKTFTVFIVLSGIIVMLLLSGFLKKASILGKSNISAYRSMLKKIDDFWITVKLAKVHNSEQFYYNKFEESNELMRKYQNKQIKNRAIPQFLYTISGIIFLIIIIYVSYQYLNIPLTSLFVLIVLFGRVFPQFGNINNDINMLVSNTASVKLILKMRNEIKENEIKYTSSKEPIPIYKQISLNNACFYYDNDAPLLNHFNETIPAGKITGITGKSGCGKTTLLDILSGLRTLKEGTITVDGKALTKDMFPAWRNNLGYLLQDSFFIDGTIRDNIIWDAGSIPSDEKLWNILKLVNAEDLIKKQEKGLDTYITNYQFHFSGGERQRLALARVLLREPKVLLLDEATSALDTENEIQIMECLERLKKDVTIIFVTHREYLKKYFDKTIEFK